MNIDVMIHYLPAFMQGLWLTVQLTFAASVLGFLLALPLTILSLSPRFYWHFPVDCFSYFFRGTPLLVQIYLLYFGAAQFMWIKQTDWLWSVLKQAYWCALIVFTLNTCAYMIEILKGALKNTSKGEIEAAMALGMRRHQILWRIMIPSGLRRALPAYSNEVIFMLHGSAQASVITLVELTGVARKMYARTFLPFEAFLMAAGFYLMLTFILVAIFKCIERRYLAHLSPRSSTSC